MVRVISSKESGQDAEGTASKEHISYNHWRTEAEKPFKDRKKVVGKRGETIVRRYHFRSDQIAQLKADAAATGGIINPLKNRIGAYWASVEALILLGINDWHSLKKIVDKMQEVMSAMPKKRKVSGKIADTDAWSDFISKPSRDGSSSVAAYLRKIEQNFRVLQRLPRPNKEECNPYGIKLAQFGMCIDIEYRVVEGCGDPLPYFRLNTTWTPDDTGLLVKPLYINPNSRRRRKGKQAVNKVETDANKVTDDTEVTDGMNLAQDTEDMSENRIDSSDASETTEVKSEEIATQEIAEQISDYTDVEDDADASKMFIGDALNDFDKQQEEFDSE